MIKLYIEVKLFRENMGRDGDGECKDFTKGVCFRGARFIFLIPYCMDMICTNILILLISAASIGMLGINKIRTQSHSAKTFRAIGIYSFQVYIYIHTHICICIYIHSQVVEKES